MYFNNPALISLISQNRQLWEVEFDGTEVKSIKPMDPKYVVEEVA